MDFDAGAETTALRERIRAFVAEHVIPLEADSASYDEHQNIRQDLLEALRAKARAAGLWALQRP
jgi:acyl-CoA dehydrogenase